MFETSRSNLASTCTTQKKTKTSSGKHPTIDSSLESLQQHKGDHSTYEPAQVNNISSSAERCEDSILLILVVPMPRVEDPCTSYTFSIVDIELTELIRFVHQFLYFYVAQHRPHVFHIPGNDYCLFQGFLFTYNKCLKGA